MTAAMQAMARWASQGRGILFVSLGLAFCRPAFAGDIWSTPITTPAAISSCGVGGVTFAGAGCLRIGGSVIASMGASSLPDWQGKLERPSAGLESSRSASVRLSEPNVHGRVSADVRWPTELGPVRAYVSVRNLPLH